MKLMTELKSERLYFRMLKIKDVKTNYKDWLADSHINKYLEVRHSVPNTRKLKQYVRQINKSIDNLLLGIFLDKNVHIGNIKLGPIDWKNKRGTIGLLIGDKNSWNKGYATEAIRTVTEYSLKVLRLKRIEASFYEGNIASFKAFIKAGYKEEARLKKYWYADERFVDAILVAYVSSQESGK